MYPQSPSPPPRTIDLVQMLTAEVGRRGRAWSPPWAPFLESSLIAGTVSFTKATLDSSERSSLLGVGVMRSKQKVLHPVSKRLILST